MGCQSFLAIRRMGSGPRTQKGFIGRLTSLPYVALPFAINARFRSFVYSQEKSYAKLGFRACLKAFQVSRRLYCKNIAHEIVSAVSAQRLLYDHISEIASKNR